MSRLILVVVEVVAVGDFMRSLKLKILLVPAFAALALSACSQNPHVDESSGGNSTSAGAQATQVVAANVVKIKDKDRDGVPDDVDECPSKPGPEENGGCPYDKIQDRDQDGIVNTEDRCPKDKGPIENQGCPYENVIADSDGDMVPDGEDLCPDEYGEVMRNGCPKVKPIRARLKDSDGDGVPDKFDQCASIPGVVFNAGCPLTIDYVAPHSCKDLDGDSIPNCLDKCPFKVGPSKNKGCPYPKKKEFSVVKWVQESLKFEFDKDVIKPESFPALNALADFMIEYPQAQLTMVGHTDEQGTEEYNQDLSQRRVDSVKAYLETKGVEGERVKAHAMGEKEPLVDTAGLTGQALENAFAQNRRVDLSIRYVKVELK